MRKFAALLITLCLIVGMSASASALTDHWIWVRNNNNGNPVQGVSVTINVLTAPGVWSSHTDDSDAGGFVHFVIEPHSTATYWNAVLDPTVDPVLPDTYNWNLSYPTTNGVWWINP